jgi:hypothetical protein
MRRKNEFARFSRFTYGVRYSIFVTSLLVFSAFLDILHAQTKNALVIDSSGKVGIGNQEPSATLHVNGRIKDSSGYVFPVNGIVMFWGSSDDFDSNGIGKSGSKVEGWALCDGKNGRPLVSVQYRLSSPGLKIGFSREPLAIKIPTGSYVSWTNYPNRLNPVGCACYIIKL